MKILKVRKIDADFDSDVRWLKKNGFNVKEDGNKIIARKRTSSVNITIGTDGKDFFCTISCYESGLPYVDEYANSAPNAYSKAVDVFMKESSVKLGKLEKQAQEEVRRINAGLEKAQRNVETVKSDLNSIR